LKSKEYCGIIINTFKEQFNSDNENISENYTYSTDDNNKNIQNLTEYYENKRNKIKKIYNFFLFL